MRDGDGMVVIEVGVSTAKRFTYLTIEKSTSVAGGAVLGSDCGAV